MRSINRYGEISIMNENEMKAIKRPRIRSELRLKTGKLYYRTLRYLLWFKMRKVFASCIMKDELPYSYFSHQTILLRQLRNVDMWMQENKIINLKNAAQKVNGIIIRPGEVFSYWKLIGKPSKRKGYVKAMVLKNGTFHADTGGGLCQLSNLIFWMTIHTPLSVIERHRHGYDVFPDSNRTQPFGSGATCFYPYGDLMIQNNTEGTYQLLISVGDKYLHGEWRVSSKPKYKIEIEERNHHFKSEYWGGYTRHNELYQKTYDLNGTLLNEKLIVSNSAIMMYTPLISEGAREGASQKTQ